MKMLDEQWNGVTYYIKAEMTVDHKDLESRIADVLNDKQKTKELEESRKRIRDAEAEVEKLKKELANSDSRNNQALRSAYQYQTGILAANEYITRGNIALSNGWSEEAIAEYDKAYAQMPKNDATYLFMGDVYRKVDDGRSFGCYKKYLNNNPNDCEMLIHVVDIYNRHARKEYDRKQKECSNCIILYMPNPYYEKAEQCYKQIIMSDPDNADAYMKLAKLCHKIDRRDEATKYMGKAIELVPNDADADVYYRMGDECFIQRNFSQAIWCYEKTMAIDPNNAELYYKMGNVYGDLKKKKDKVKYYQKAAQLGHEDAQKWLQDNKYKW
jgi:superkiller protein 3